MASIYPDAIDGYAQLPLVIDTVTEVDAITVNRLREAIINVETELGTLPSGTFDDVKTRLEDLDTEMAGVQAHASSDWDLSGHDGTANYLAGFDASGNPTDIDPSTVGILDHTQLLNVIWAAGGHTGTPNYLAGFDGTGNPTNIDPSTIGVSDHTALTNLAWSSSAHTGTASFLAGFDGSGNPTNVDPTSIGDDLAATLLTGNTTGGTDIVVSSGDEIAGVDGATGTDLILRPGNGSAGNDGAIHVGSATGSVVGNARGENAIDLQRFRSNATKVAAGIGSVVIGYNSSTGANAAYGFARGYNCTANGWSSHAEGVGTTTTYGFGSFGQHAEGAYTTAYGKYSHAEGGQTKTHGPYSHAEGYATTTGYLGTTTAGQYAHAEGQGTFAIGRASHAEGVDSIAGSWSGLFSFGTGAHAEGISTLATGSGAHAEGTYTQAVASASHAEGSYSEVSSSGGSGHAEGWGSRCIANWAHAGGRYSIADTAGQFARSSDDFSSTVNGKGGSQFSLLHAGERTTDATATVLTFYNERLILRASMVLTFTIEVTARQNSGTSGTAGDSASWFFNGRIKRDASNNTTMPDLWFKQSLALTDEATTILADIASSIAETPTYSDAAAAAWTVQITADDTNEALQIEVTGEANKNIVWSALVTAVEAGLGQNI